MTDKDLTANPEYVNTVIDMFKHGPTEQTVVDLDVHIANQEDPTSV